MSGFYFQNLTTGSSTSIVWVDCISLRFQPPVSPPGIPVFIQHSAFTPPIRPQAGNSRSPVTKRTVSTPEEKQRRLEAIKVALDAKAEAEAEAEQSLSTPPNLLKRSLPWTPMNAQVGDASLPQSPWSPESPLKRSLPRTSRDEVSDQDEPYSPTHRIWTKKHKTSHTGTFLHKS